MAGGWNWAFGLLWDRLASVQDAGETFNAMASFVNLVGCICPGCGAVAEVPEGHPKIAQRFNVGTGARERTGPVPKGRPSRASKRVSCQSSTVPSGQDPLLNLVPTLKRWAILRCPFGTIRSATLRAACHAQSRRDETLALPQLKSEIPVLPVLNAHSVRF